MAEMLSELGRKITSGALAVGVLVLSFMGIQLGGPIGWTLVFLCIIAGFVGLALIWAGKFVDAEAQLPSDHIRPYQFMLYLSHESEWGRRVGQYETPDFDSIKGPQYGVPKPLAAVNQWAKEAQKAGSPLRAYGVPHTGGDAVPIPHTFWMTNGLDPIATLDRYGPSRTEPKQGGTGFRYEHVKIERAGVLKVWPRMSFLHRQLQRWKDRKEQRQRAAVEVALRSEVEAAEQTSAPLSGGALAHSPTIKVEPPPAPLTESEVDRRVRVIDDLLTLIEGLAKDAHARAYQAQGAYKDDLPRTGAAPLIQGVHDFRRDVKAIEAKIEEVTKRCHFILPKAVTNFEYDDRLNRAADKIVWALSRFPEQVSERMAELLEDYRYHYAKALAVYEQWLKDAAANLRHLRASLFDRLRN